jgi:hypothetical protein
MSMILTGRVFDAWSTRWYIPLLLLSAALLLVLVLALASVEMLAGDTPTIVSPQAWGLPLARIDAALARGDAAGARRAWAEAQAAAIQSTHWEGLLAVGDASRRFGVEGRARARQAYLTALLRARRDHSIDGLLGAASAFGQLGDRDVLTYAVRIAEREAGRDPVKRRRVRAVADRWLSPSLDTRPPDSPFAGGDHP